MTVPAPPAYRPPQDRQHFRRLDGARAVAILLVLMSHCFGQAYDRWQLPWRADSLLASTAGVPPSFVALYPMTWGWAGVALSFVLSGFLIHHSTVRAGGAFAPVSFVLRRTWRLGPSYLLALLTFAAVAGCRAGADHRALGRQVFAHLLLVHNFRPSTYTGINGSFWTMAVEVQFYVLYPLLLWVRRRAGHAAPLAVAGAVSVGSWVAFGWRVDWVHATVVPTFVWWNTLPLWSCWVMGMFLADRFAAGRRVFDRPVLWGTALTAAFMAGSLAKPTWAVAFTASAGAALVAVEAALWSRRGWGWLTNRWLVGFGLVSYSFYLWHQPLLRPIAAALPQRGVPVVARFAMLFVATLASVGAFAWVLNRLIERPSQMIGRRFAPRRSVPPVP